VTDPGLITWDDSDDEYLDPRFIVWVEDEDDLGNSAEPPDSSEAEPAIDNGNNLGNPGLVYVRWQQASGQLIEGATVTTANASRVFVAQLVGVGPTGVYVRTYPIDLAVNARVTGGTATTGDFELRTNLQTSDTVVALVFPAGSSSTGLAVWAKDAGGVEGTETVEITLDDTTAIALPAGSVIPARVAPSTTVGPDVMTIEIIDSTAPAVPEWRWVGGTSAAYPEASGDLFLEVALDGPSTAPITIEFSSVPGSPAAVAGTNYVALAAGSNRVTFAAGETSKLLRFRLLNDPAVAPGPNLEVEITGAVIAGICTDPASDTYTVEIIDTPVGTPRSVQWWAATQSYPEPLNEAGEKTQRLRATTTVGFVTRTDVPYTITNTNTANGVGYTISGGDGVPPGVVRFEPNAGYADLFFRPRENGIVGDATVLLELETLSGVDYTLGSIDALTITIQENSSGVQEATYLAGARGIRTGRSLIEATCAVVPPSATLPSYYCVNTNETCQVVGLARNSQGYWDAVRVIAMAADDVAAGALGGTQVSYPGAAVGTPIEIALGTASTPAEGYHADVFTGLTPTIVPCNTGAVPYLRALTDSLATSSTAIKPQWVGPTATDPMFEQTGADLVRTEYYRVVLRESGDVTSDGLTAPADPDSRCMTVEMWIKRRVDCDVVEVEGILSNSTWDKKQDPHAANTRTSGTVNLLSFVIDGVPASWAATWATANPNESFAGTTVTLLPARAGEAYEFPPCATMPFRFALYHTGTSSAGEAQRVLRYRGVATSTGYYGVTRNNCWGVMGDVILDPVRAGYRARWGNVDHDGWRAYEETGEAWVAANTRPGWLGGAYGGSRMNARLGWFQTGHPRETGEAAGGGINGLTALFPSAGWCEDAWYALACNIMRQRVGIKDVFSGDEAWQQVLVDEYAAFGGDGTNAPHVQVGNTRLGMHRIPQFNTRELVDPPWPGGAGNIMGATLSTFCKAPTTRPWNTDEGTPDADRLVISHETTTGFQQTDFPHCARYREHVEEGWWGCWSPLAWWHSMQLGAWVSRGMSAHIVDPAAPGYAQQGYGPFEYHPAFIVATCDAAGSPLEKGRPYVGASNPQGGHWWGMGNVRGWGHAATIIAQAYAIGGDRQREMIVVPGGVNWFEAWATFITNYTTPYGLFATEDTDFHNCGEWGNTNLPAKRGALPASFGATAGGTNATVPPFTRHHAAVMFHHNFIAAGAWAVFWRGIKGQNSALQLKLRKVLRIPYYVREAQRSWTTVQGEWPLGVWAIVARGEYGYTDTSSPTIPDVGTFMAGDYGHDFGSGTNAAQNAQNAIGYHAPKFGLCVYAYREARDSGDTEAELYLRPALCYFSDPNETAPVWDLATFQLVYARQLLMTSAGITSQNPQVLEPHTDQTFLSPFIHEVLNLTT